MRLCSSDCGFTYFLICTASRPSVPPYPVVRERLSEYRFLSSKCLPKLLIAHFLSAFYKATISGTVNLDALNWLCVRFLQGDSSQHSPPFSTLDSHHATRLAQPGPTTKNGGLCLLFNKGYGSTGNSISEGYSP